MGNLSVLDRNIIHAFAGTDHADEAERVYLAKRDRQSPEQAEADAYRWERVCRVINLAVRFAEASTTALIMGLWTSSAPGF